MAEKKINLPRYRRVENPPSMRLTARDRQILEAVHAYDGMLGFSQLLRMFFTGRSQAEQRMKLLYQNRYLNRPNREQRMRIPDMVYWLDVEGARLVAGSHGVPLQDFTWRKAPRWFQVDHDLAVNTFRLDMEEACQRSKLIELVNWIPESEFWAHPDRIEYRYQGKNISRNIRPDGFFILKSKNIRVRFLLEIDRSTEDNPRFLREKILPGLGYLPSCEYRERFGDQGGRWLVVTTGERRMMNMLSQAQRAKAKGLFYFTTYEMVKPDTVLSAPIWRRADREEFVPLLFLNSRVA